MALRSGSRLYREVERAFWLWLDEEPWLTATELAEAAVEDFHLDGRLLNGDTWLTRLARTVNYRDAELGR